MNSYRPALDRLEMRQLMASDLDVTSAPDAVSHSGTASSAFVSSPSAGGPQSDSSTAAVPEYVVANPILDYGLDSIIERTGSMAVIVSRGSSQIMAIQDLDSATPKVAFRLQLDLSVQSLNVDGTRAIVFGQTTDNHTQVIAIDLNAGRIDNRVLFRPGMFTFSHLRGDDAWVVLSQSTKPVISPSGVSTVPNDSRLIHLRWGEKGLVEQSSLSVDHGLWSVAQNRLVMATLMEPGSLEYTTTLHVYDLGPGKLSEAASWKIPSSYAKSISITSDGQHASLIRGGDNPGLAPKTFVDLLDLKANSIQMRQRFEIDDWAEVYQHDSETAILYSQGDRQLITLDLRSANTNQTRKRSWAVPEGFGTSLGVAPLSNGRYGITAQVSDPGPFFGTASNPDKPADGTYLLILDPLKTELIIRRVDSLIGHVISLEPGTDKVGVWGWARGDGERSTFTFGELDKDQKFSARGAIAAVDVRGDAKWISTNRLITADSDQVAVYDLAQPEKALLRNYVREGALPLQAPDLQVQVSMWGASLDVMSSFTATTSFERIRLVKLEGAPADVRIEDSRVITFPRGERLNRKPIDFDYIISDGVSQAKGRIHVVYNNQFLMEPPPPTPADPASATATVSSKASSNTLKHNTEKPLDVDGDGSVSALDVLVVINAINSDGLNSIAHAVDTSGNGLLEPIDVLLVINFLNNQVRLGLPKIANASEEELNEIRVAALKYELAQAYPAGKSPTQDILVGLQPATDDPLLASVFATLEFVVNPQIQNLVQLPTEYLAQPGLKEFNLGSPSQAIWRDGPVQNIKTGAPVQLIRVGRPQDDVDGVVRLEIIRGYGPPDGSLGFILFLQKSDGQWHVIAREPSFVT